MQTDRTVVITGAAGGAERALVHRFLENGDTVVGIDLREEDLDSGDRRFEEKFIKLRGDLSKERACAEFAGRIHAKTGTVDVLVNCAGYYPIRAFEEMSPAEWRQIIDISLTGTFLIIPALLPLMKGRHARIISIGSASIFEGVACQAHYVSAKAGIVGLSRSFAIELGAYGITVNVITPGLTLTEPVKQNFKPEVIERSARYAHYM